MPAQPGATARRLGFGRPSSIISFPPTAAGAADPRGRRSNVAEPALDVIMTSTSSDTAPRPPIHVTEGDFDLLSALVEGLTSPSPGAVLLAEELDRAVVVGPRYRGQPFARLNSIVEYEDIDTGHRRALRITLPQDARLEDDRISILSPAGAALLGLKVGQTMHWEVRDGRTQTLRVLAVRDI